MRTTKRKKLTLSVINAVTKKGLVTEQGEGGDVKKAKLKDLEKFSKSVRFPLLWKEEIARNIDYPMDLSGFIVEAIKEKMERENINTFIG